MIENIEKNKQNINVINNLKNDEYHDTNVIENNNNINKEKNIETCLKKTIKIKENKPIYDEIKYNIII